eukprot:CAMPEP_0195129540 /NCGR_PEP_ID=MMETSP0448-20130528/141367_1 /TAXON_ID=66468 /ORGANISM="Heterocapsa triquestra, Strain CCMP 448" /LENGTH=67 /DNA_ID=CAMNT_0040167389 /DNA_START=33 /DNA_END=232 /DNA_ORIENTATION=+
MYDKFNIRIRVTWPETSGEEPPAVGKSSPERAQTSMGYPRGDRQQPPASVPDMGSALAPVVQQLQQV